MTSRTIDTPTGWLRVSSIIESDAEALRIHSFAYEAHDRGDACMRELALDALFGDVNALRLVRAAMES